MKEKFPNLVKETDMQIQEAQKVPNKMDAKRPTPRHIIIKMPKVKDKERILKQQEKSSQLPTGEFPYDCELISQKNLCGLQEIGKKHSKS